MNKLNIMRKICILLAIHIIISCNQGSVSEKSEIKFEESCLAECQKLNTCTKATRENAEVYSNSGRNKLIVNKFPNDLTKTIYVALEESVYETCPQSANRKFGKAVLN